MEYNPFIVLFFATISGLCCTAIAKNRGYKKPGLWFFFGLFFGLLGVVFFYFFTLKKKKQEEVESTANEVVVIKNTTPTWFYLNKEHVQNGPVTVEEIETLLDTHAIDKETYVWAQGMTEWEHLHEVGIFQKE